MTGCVSSSRMLVLSMVAVAVSVPAMSATFVVTVESDGNDGTCDSHCTLREAVLAANGSSGLDTVVLPGGIYGISIAGAGEDAAATGDLDITDPLVLLGSGARHTVIDGGGLDRVLDVRPGGELELERLSVRNGFVAGGGGGIRAIGDVTMTACSITGNTTTSFGFGGGISSTSMSGVLSIERSTIADNTSDGGGGALVVGGFATLDEVTIAGNQSVVDFGGGIYLFTDAVAELNGCTVVGNSSALGGGLLAEGGSTFTVSNSIIAANSAPSRPDCSGSYVSLGYNLVGDASTCSGFGAVGDMVGSASSPLDPLLAALGPAGGETDTCQPIPASPAIDAGCPASPGSGFGTCNPTDQRLVVRPIDGGAAAGAICDIGAHEAGGLFFGGFETSDANRWSSAVGAVAGTSAFHELTKHRAELF